ncbi:FHA domain-containing protein [Tautonia rosea]|uniref:FHA domain-containing protein n=1 Tax=Tautonia rosea TaxID=2728037 RepID=UPI00147489A9|nr:FHA domain-containing protein [Tautonia rosea]
MQRFWESCGARGPMEVRIEGGADAGDVHRIIPGPFAVIGRDPKADLVLEDEAVSRRHAFVQVIAGRVFWMDLGSRTGIETGGIVAPMGWLDEGGTIGIGPFRVSIVVKGLLADPSGDRPSPLADRGSEGWPDASFEFPNHPGGAARWRMGRVLTLVGRGTDCRLRIGDDGISHFHCALLRTPKGPWVVDLLSRTGIRLEGARVRCAPLEPGANLHVGRYRMIVRPVDLAWQRSDSGEALAADVSPLPREQLPEVAPRWRPPATREERQRVETPAVLGPSGDLDAYIGRLEQMQQQMFDQFHQMMMAMFQAFGSMQRDQMTQVREELDRIKDLGQELRSLQETVKEAAPEAPRTPSASASSGKEPRETATERPASAPWQPRDRTDREVHDLICQRIAQIEGERQGRWKRVMDLVTGNSGG